MVGFSCARRPRRYTLLVHKHFATLVHDPYTLLEQFVAILSKCKPLLRDCMMASPADLREELQAHCAKRHLAQPKGPLSTVDWSQLLNDREKRAVCVYHTLWTRKFHTDAHKDKAAIFHLGDNPWSRPVMGYDTLPSVRTNGGLCWHPASRRWLTPREKLCALGMPVYPLLAASAGVPPVVVAGYSNLSHLAGDDLQDEVFWLIGQSQTRARCNMSMRNACACVCFCVCLVVVHLLTSSSSTRSSSRMWAHQP